MFSSAKLSAFRTTFLQLLLPVFLLKWDTFGRLTAALGTKF